MILAKHSPNSLGKQSDSNSRWFKQDPNKPIASAVHHLADKAATTHIMKQLNDIYSQNQMNNWAADYPLGQRLLLAPMAKGLNNNMASLQQLKAKTSLLLQSNHHGNYMSCKGPQHQCNICDNGRKSPLVPLRTTDAGSTPNQWHMHFFQAIDNYLSGQGVAFTMLPSAATFGCNTVLGLIPFTRWLLEPVYGKQQLYNLDLAFFPEALQEMALETWDEQNNCIQQKEGNLLGQGPKGLGHLWSSDKTRCNPTCYGPWHNGDSASGDTEQGQSIPAQPDRYHHSQHVVPPTIGQW